MPLANLRMPKSQMPSEDSPLLSNWNERREDNNNGAPGIRGTAPGGSEPEAAALHEGECPVRHCFEQVSMSCEQAVRSRTARHTTMSRKESDNWVRRANNAARIKEYSHWF